MQAPRPIPYVLRDGRPFPLRIQARPMDPGIHLHESYDLKMGSFDHQS